MSAFADVEITKDWNDDLTGTSAKGRSVPSVTLTGETSYEKLLNLMYPVGSYYITEADLDPNEAWGGTWVRVEGKMLLGATDGGATGTSILSNSSVAAGSTGGEATHTLNVTEMPSHNHAFSSTGATFGGTSNIATEHGMTGTQYGSGGYGFWQFGTAVENTGGSQAHNNMPPFVSVNIWKRTA